MNTMIFYENQAVTCLLVNAARLLAGSKIRCRKSSVKFLLDTWNLKHKLTMRYE
jgi:hypothetical protein